MLQRRRGFLRCVSPMLCVLALGSGCESEEEDAEANSGPLVGVLELPISHRHTDREPASATRVEIGPTAIRVGGENALALDAAKIPPGDRQGDLVPKLQAKFKASPARALTLVVHGATPYATLARVIHTAFESGVSELYFQVRKPAATTETGWMRLTHVHFTDHVDPPNFEEGEMMPWQSFTDVWGEVKDACREDPRGDCGYEPDVKAEGGKLDLRIRVRGAGLSIRFRQYLAEGEVVPEKKKAAGPAMLDGIAPPPSEEEEESDPSTEAQYTVRAEQAARPESPVTSMLEPVCGNKACAVVMEVEGISLSARVISVIGAAFPDGSPEPYMALLRPPE